MVNNSNLDVLSVLIETKLELQNIQIALKVSTEYYEEQIKTDESVKDIYPVGYEVYHSKHIGAKGEAEYMHNRFDKVLTNRIAEINKAIDNLYICVPVPVNELDDRPF